MGCCGCSGGGGGAGADMGASQISGWLITPNAIVFASDGLTAGTVAGTGTARLPAQTNLATSTRRIGLVSAAAINSLAGVRTNTVQVVHGITTPGAGRFLGGGWKLLLQWSISDVVRNAEARMFCGIMVGGGAPAVVDPGTQQDCIGFGNDTGDTTLRVYARDNATTTEIDLGANFPVDNTGPNQFWRGYLECFAGQTGNPMRYRYSIERLQTGHRVDGEIAVGPRFGQNGFVQLWRSTGPADPSAVGLDVSMVRLGTNP